MLKNTQIEMGDLRGTIYDFLEVNDVLPMHSHDSTTVHITIVARGSFKVNSLTWEKTVTAGNVIDWQSNQSHEFIALEPNSRIVNIIKHVR